MKNISKKILTFCMRLLRWLGILATARVPNVGMYSIRRVDPVDVRQILPRDLRMRARGASCSGERVEAFEYLLDGFMLPATVVFFPESRIAGVSWGADICRWTTAQSSEDALSRYLTDQMVDL